MKSGTAQKMVVNMISTAAMVRLGKTYGNVMVDVRPTNEKLRARAVRMVQTLGDVSAELARETLDASAWDVKAALVMLAKECTVAEAHALLDAAGGHVRVVLERS
jgi:N-acetylmuramic acid 6-phosphate etherase